MACKGADGSLIRSTATGAIRGWQSRRFPLTLSCRDTDATDAVCDVTTLRLLQERGAVVDQK